MHELRQAVRDAVDDLGVVGALRILQEEVAKLQQRIAGEPVEGVSITATLHDPVFGGR